ncbi:hypothetical protein JTE90_001265 [Oedothorax gibbosus]|uniref:RRM domain-containing protein n=1 Tax=Oedothorax gibbosus TaxID=931172 RepID=A0AAV6V2K8_9ARAC|nr:hypothetical protein JTE90_001265 [Oedothorax gibbosus]
MDVDDNLEAKEEDTFSDSTEGSSDDEDVDEEKITQLQKQVNKSPFTYELHVDLINMCKKACDLDKLRAARENMSAHFPLSPELWLDWLQDEKNVAGQITDKNEKVKQNDIVTALFERAIKDYPSIKIWSDYVNFSIGKIGNTWPWPESGLENTRQTFEKALASVGIHVTEGYMIWEAYREFETIYLLNLRNEGSSEADIKKQEERIFNLYKRQLSIPLVDMSSTYDQFKELFSDLPNVSEVDYAYKKALKKLDELQQYEDALGKCDNEQYDSYKQYIQYEKTHGDPIRVQNIYERALIDNCLKDELWLEYIKYIEKVLKIQSVEVQERSIRNCPWSVPLLVSHGRALERYENPHETIKTSYESALMMGFTREEDFRDLWLAYLDYLKRRIDNKAATEEEGIEEISKVFDRAIMQMEQYFWGCESEYSIRKYFAFFNAKYKKDMEAARQTWREVIDHNHKTEARFWLDFAHFERLHGDSAHYRKTVEKALSCVIDYPETFVDLLITFEREEGTLESFEKSFDKCETQMKIINEKRQKSLEEATVSPEKHDNKRPSSRRSPRGSKLETADKGDSRTNVKMDSEGFKIPPLPGKTQHATEEASSSDYESHRKKRPHDEDSREDSKKRKVEVSHGQSVKHDPSNDYRTVFLSNLSYQIKEETIRDLFSQVGEIEEVRLVKDYKGRSKGFCYVVYKSQDSVKSALAKDREQLDGRPVLVSPCEDRKSNPTPQPKFKFGTGLEKNKLFVKGLPFSTTKEDLENMFKQFGILKDVRLVTYRNGHSKGLAYVDFEDEASASNAVVKLDGSKVQESVISVAISNPPPRKPRGEFSSAPFISAPRISDSLGGGGGAAKGPRGRGRTQLSLVPRSVVRQPVTSKKPPRPSANGNGQSSEPMDTSSQENKPLSNSDFAKMMQK